MSSILSGWLKSYNRKVSYPKEPLFIARLSSNAFMLGKDIYSGNDDDPGNVLMEMLHSCTPSANKEKILLSFCNNGHCSVVASFKCLN